MKKTGIRIGRRIYEVRSTETLRFAEKIEREIGKLPNDLDGNKFMEQPIIKVLALLDKIKD